MFYPNLVLEASHPVRDGEAAPHLVETQTPPTADCTWLVLQ